MNRQYDPIRLDGNDPVRDLRHSVDIHIGTSVDLHDRRPNCSPVHDQWFIWPTLCKQYASEQKNDAKQCGVSQIAPSIHGAPL